GHPHDAGLRKRRVDHTLLAEFVQEFCSHSEHAAASPDVLSHDQHAVVGLHLLPQGVVNGLDHVLLGHDASPVESSSVGETSALAFSSSSSSLPRPMAPCAAALRSAYTWSNADSGSGSGAFQARSTSRSTSDLISARSSSS